MAVGPITNGISFNYFTTFSVVDTDFPDDPQVEIGFRGVHQLILAIESGTSIEFSFNGNTVAGKLTANAPSEKLQFISPHKKIWFKASAAATIWVGAYHLP